MSFTIQEGSILDIEKIIDTIKYLYDLLANKEWYAIGLANYDRLVEMFNGGMVMIKALYQDDLAGFLLVEDHIDPDSEIATEIPKEEIPFSIEMDNAGVLPLYRGNHLEQKMILEAESILKKKNPTIRYSYTTVHPDNLASFNSLEHIGYQKYKKKLMYGGKNRYIMRKEL